MGISRKDFLRGSALGMAGVAGAAAVGGTLAGCSTSTKNSLLPDKWDVTADVVVVGAGGAGLAAAIGALDGKAGKVIVLEKLTETISSSTAICGGFITFAGSALQKKLGIDDSADKFYADIMEWCKTSEPDVVRLYVDNTLPYYDLITSLKVPMNEQLSDAPGNKTMRTHTVNPAQHVMALEKAVRDKGGEIRFSTSGKRLITNPMGEVVGIEADANGKSVMFKANKAVIMATGGFTHAAEMLDECIPGLGKVMALSCPGHTAEGHKAVFELGGQFAGRPTVYSVQGMHPTSRTMAGYAETFLYGAIEVNSEGVRKVNEALYWGSDRTRVTLQQPTNKDGVPVVFQILDQKAYDLAVKAGPPIGLGESTIKLLVKGDTLEDLATKLNMPRLVETVTKYNEDIDKTGVDSMMGRDTMVGTGTPKITKLDTAPYYSFENTAWLAYDPTCSFKVDKDLHVLDQFGKPVQRLYLVGEIMLRSVTGDHYIYGLATGAGGALGLVAGKYAAALKNWA